MKKEEYTGELKWVDGVLHQKVKVSEETRLRDSMGVQFTHYCPERFEWRPVPHDTELTGRDAKGRRDNASSGERTVDSVFLHSALAVIAAARCIMHWHDRENGGMVVSAEHVYKLWDALHKFDDVNATRTDSFGDVADHDVPQAKGDCDVPSI